MNHCPFCELNNNEKHRIIQSLQYVNVIFSNPRLTPCHLLIVPRRHVEKTWELSEEEKKELLDVTISYQQKIVERIAPGCDIRQNYRPFLEESKLKVNHLHFHLLPRELDDQIFQKVYVFQKDLFHELPEEDIEKYKNLLL